MFFQYLISAQILPASLDTTIPLIIFNNYNCFLLGWQSVPVTWAPCLPTWPLELLSTVLISSLPDRLGKNLCKWLLACPFTSQATQLHLTRILDSSLHLGSFLCSPHSPEYLLTDNNCSHNTWDVGRYQVSQNWILSTTLFLDPFSRQHCQRPDEGWDCSVWIVHTSGHFACVLPYSLCDKPRNTSSFWTQLIGLQI